MNTIAQIDRHNNFDFLRLIFASAVIVSHSYPLSGIDEVFAKWSANQFDLGGLSVNIFFAMSGYLIFQSLQRSKNIADYIWKRVLRLYPALIVILLITMLILPLIYKGQNIANEISYWSYLSNGLSLYNLQHQVQGVFGNNVYPQAINGSLWTLSYEFTMYISLLGLFLIRTQKISLYVLITAFSVMYLAFNLRPTFLSKIFEIIHIDTQQLYRLGSYFLAGAILTFVNLQRFNTTFFRCSLLIILLLSLFFYKFKYVAPVILSILIISIGILQTKYISKLGYTFGDISYGMYIYGFFVQQLLMCFFDLSVYQLMVTALLITIIPAYLSWHYVEKQALRYKNIFR